MDIKETILLILKDLETRDMIEKNGTHYSFTETGRRYTEVKLGERWRDFATNIEPINEVSVFWIPTVGDYSIGAIPFGEYGEIADNTYDWHFIRLQNIKEIQLITLAKLFEIDIYKVSEEELMAADFLEDNMPTI